MSISAADVKALRDRTGAAMMDCKAALAEAEGDADRAVEILRVKGQASAAKREGRGTNEGVVASYIHANDRVGAMVEVQCETDFVARNEQFKAFAKEVALQVAAAQSLRFVSDEEISEDFKASELEIFRTKAAAEGKPEQMLDQIAEGMWNKSLVDIVLLRQPSIRPEHDGKTIEQIRAELSGLIGENVEVKRFARFQVGVE